jgi:prephenate dehydrogenase
MDVGFIGLGNMGAHMARRLVEAGHRVFVYDTRQEAIGNLAALRRGRHALAGGSRRCRRDRDGEPADRPPLCCKSRPARME